MVFNLALSFRGARLSTRPGIVEGVSNRALLTLVVWLAAALAARSALAQNSATLTRPAVTTIAVAPWVARFYWADCVAGC